MLTVECFKELFTRATVLAPRWQDACEFWVRAMTPGDDIHHVFRGKPEISEVNWEREDLERRLIEALPSFKSPDNPQRIYHLKLLRRFFLRRYALCRAIEVNMALLEVERAVAGRHGGRWRGLLFGAWTGMLRWLYLHKDLLLLRAALAQVLGYGILLGSGNTAAALGESGGACAGYAVCGSGLLLTWFLLYLNARDQIGSGSNWRCWWRALLVLAVMAAWSTAIGGLGWWFCSKIGKYGFQARQAVVVGSMAILVSVVGQFFFGREGSIADPV